MVVLSAYQVDLMRASFDGFAAGADGHQAAFRDRTRWPARSLDDFLDDDISPQAVSRFCVNRAQHKRRVTSGYDDFRAGPLRHRQAGLLRDFGDEVAKTGGIGHHKRAIRSRVLGYEDDPARF
jgi:hypothetical protein